MIDAIFPHHPLENVGVAAQGGQRRSQFMGRVGDKLAVRIEGNLEAVEHGVEGFCQPLDFVIRLR